VAAEPKLHVFSRSERVCGSITPNIGGSITAVSDNTQVLAPNIGVSLTLNGNITLTRADEVITSNSSLCCN
jgi:hypothetical protein